MSREPDFYVIQPGERYPQAYGQTRELAQEALDRLRLAEPAQWAAGKLMPCADYFAERESEYLAQPTEEIDSDRFFEMLGILPPMDWRTEGGIERFNMSEMEFGQITRQFARIGERYFSKFVRRGDRSTYIQADVLK